MSLQFVLSLLGFCAGSFALLETLPTPPLLDLRFIAATRSFLAYTGITFGLLGLLLTMRTFRVSGRGEWELLASILLASAGLAGGLFTARMTG